MNDETTPPSDPPEQPPALRRPPAEPPSPPPRPPPAESPPPAAAPPPARCAAPACGATPPPPPRPPPRPRASGKASGGMRALGVLLALVLAFGAAVMIVASGEIADTPDARGDRGGRAAERRPVLRGLRDQQDDLDRLRLRQRRGRCHRRPDRPLLRRHRHSRPPVRSGRDRGGDTRGDSADHLVGPQGAGLDSAAVAADQLKPAYLIAGTDAAKIDEVVARLRARAEAEGGLETLPAPGVAVGPTRPRLSRRCRR